MIKEELNSLNCNNILNENNNIIDFSDNQMNSLNEIKSWQNIKQENEKRQNKSIINSEIHDSKENQRDIKIQVKK